MGEQANSSSVLGNLLPLFQELFGGNKVLCRPCPLLVLAVDAQRGHLLGEVTSLAVGLGALVAREVQHVLLQGATSFKQVGLEVLSLLGLDVLVRPLKAHQSCVECLLPPLHLLGAAWLVHGVVSDLTELRVGVHRVVVLVVDVRDPTTKAKERQLGNLSRGGAGRSDAGRDHCGGQAGSRLAPQLWAHEGLVSGQQPQHHD
mmetsp:Transcript_15250/g.28734  ORF Transcript_15250/g.28734 Transcript_15250/m.28734 type:complete len:202 (+) Transcript_15250:101-706(+)